MSETGPSKKAEGLTQLGMHQLINFATPRLNLEERLG